MAALIERLNLLRHKNINGHTEELERLRQYPAMLATFTMGVAAVLGKREEFLARLLTQPLWTSPFSSRERQVPAVYLNPRRIISGSINDVCSPGEGRTWHYPQSRWLREELREPLRIVEPDDEAYRTTFHRLEFLASLMALDTKHVLASPWSGEFLLEEVWGYDKNGLAPDIEREINDAWPLLQAGAFNTDVERAKNALTALVKFRSQNHPW